MDQSKATELLEVMVALWPVPEWSEGTLRAYASRFEELPHVQTEAALRQLADTSERRPTVAAIVAATRGNPNDRHDIVDDLFRSKFTQWRTEEREPLSMFERGKIAQKLRAAAGRNRKPGADNQAWQCLLEDMAEHYETSADEQLRKNCPKISDYLGKGNAHGVDDAYTKGPAKTVEEARARSGLG